MQTLKDIIFMILLYIGVSHAYIERYILIDFEVMGVEVLNNKTLKPDLKKLDAKKNDWLQIEGCKTFNCLFEK